MLGDTSLDAFQTHNLKTSLPTFEVVIPLKKDLIDRFIKSRKSLSDCKIVAFLPEKDTCDVIINYDPNHGTNRITIPFLAETSGGFDVSAYNIDPIAKAFAANSDFRDAKISISEKGLMEISFKGEDYEVKYYLNKLQLD